MSLEKSSPPYGTQLYLTTRLDIYRSIRLNCELFAGRSVIGVPGSDTLLQAPPQGGQGQHVKYNWRTLQLLPGMERPSYAGAQMEVHEGLDGQLLVQYQGRTIPTQEAPPRPGVLRDSNGPLRYGPGLDRRVNGVGNHPKESLASLGLIEADSATWNGDGRVRKPPASPRRKPTPRQRVRWKAVRQAKLRGLSIRATARELGIHRNTVCKYAEAKSPPMTRTRVRSRVSQSDGMTVA